MFHLYSYWTHKPSKRTNTELAVLVPRVLWGVLLFTRDKKGAHEKVEQCVVDNGLWGKLHGSQLPPRAITAHAHPHHGASMPKSQALCFTIVRNKVKGDGSSLNESACSPSMWALGLTSLRNTWAVSSRFAALSQSLSFRNSISLCNFCVLLLVR